MKTIASAVVTTTLLLTTPAAANALFSGPRDEKVFSQRTVIHMAKTPSLRKMTTEVEPRENFRPVFSFLDRSAATAR